MKMSQTNYHLKLLQTEYKILKYLGVWTGNEKLKYPKLYLMYMFWTNICVYISMEITQIVQTYFVIGDIPKLADICYTLLALILVQTDGLILYAHRKEINELNKIMEGEEAQMFTETHRVIFEENIKIWKILRKIQYIFTIAQILLLIVSSLITLIKQEKTLPFPDVWVPFDINKSPNFEYVFFIQNFGAINAALTFVSCQFVIYGYFSFLATQCDLLCYNLRHVKEFPEDGSSEFQCSLGTCVQQYIQMTR